MFRGVLLPALLVLVALSGCTSGGGGGGGGPATVDPTPEVFEQVEVTDTTGAIRGIVVSEAIVPIAGVLVVVTGGGNYTTGADGAFIFSNLEPGSYFLTATKPGYFPVQASADVVAGEKEPPITKVQLLVDAGSQPFSELLQWTGFFGCGTGTSAGGGIGFNPCAVDALLCSLANVCLLNTANTHTFPFGVAGRIPDLAQAEMVWEGTQPLGNALNLGWHRSGTADFTSVSGESPLTLPATQEQIIDAKGEEVTALLARVFPGTGQELTVTLQQRFDVYTHYFYGFVPREGWTFVGEGPCSTPEHCS